MWTGAHWVKQISLDLPRASDPVWVAARQEQCTSIMALPVSNSQPGLQRNQDGVVREVAKGTTTGQERKECKWEADLFFALGMTQFYQIFTLSNLVHWLSRVGLI